MKSTFLYILLLLCFVSATAQQNLIPNPSFEEYWSCPIENDLGNGEFAKCKHWWYPHPPTVGTSDYFNRCNTGIVAVPNNFWGYQEAFDGDGYVGLDLVAQSLITEEIIGAEAIACRLLGKLKECYRYKISMRISLANFATHGFTPIEIILTKDSLLYSSLEDRQSLIPDWKSKDLIIDTLDWVLIEGEFRASGGEQYLSIGKFSEVNYTDLVFNDSTLINFLQETGMYYYIDSLSLTELGDDGSCSISFPNIFSPNTDGINDYISIAETIIDELTIYNRWGGIVAILNANTPVWNGDCKTKICSEGVYYYIATKDGELLKKGTIQLIR